MKLDPAPGLDLEALAQAKLEGFQGTDTSIEFPSPLEGSNNWTVSGKLTATGKPLLANDPHRTIAIPSLRYVVHLVAPGWDVIGATEPALPGVSIGHNENIAWGLTVFPVDQEDLYLEDLNPADPLQYKTENGWARMTVEETTIAIRGAAARKVQLKFTRHGRGAVGRRENMRWRCVGSGRSRGRCRIWRRFRWIARKTGRNI